MPPFVKGGRGGIGFVPFLNGGALRLAPGAARHAAYFLCAAKESRQRNAAPVRRCCAVPCVARLLRRLWNSRYALKQSSPKPPSQPARLGGTQGVGRPAITISLSPNLATKYLFPFCATEAGRIHREVWASTVRAPQQGMRCVPCQGELRSPRRTHPAEGSRRLAQRGRHLWVTFLGEARKVTCCRQPRR